MSSIKADIFSSGWTLFAPGGFTGPDFVFTYGAGFVFAAIYIGSKLYETVYRRRQVVWGKKASEMDFRTNLEEIEALTIASEEQLRAEGKPTTVWGRVDRFLF